MIKTLSSIVSNRRFWRLKTGLQSDAATFRKGQVVALRVIDFNHVGISTQVDHESDVIVAVEWFMFEYMFEPAAAFEARYMRAEDLLSENTRKHDISNGLLAAALLSLFGIGLILLCTAPLGIGVVIKTVMITAACALAVTACASGSASAIYAKKERTALDELSKYDFELLQA